MKQIPLYVMRAQMREVFQYVAIKHGMEEAELYIRDRSAPVMRARREAWCRLRERGFSYTQIASHAGWNHKSVMHGVMKERARMAVND